LTLVLRGLNHKPTTILVFWKTVSTSHREEEVSDYSDENKEDPNLGRFERKNEDIPPTNRRLSYK
jgi:hypothetical protein